MLSLPRKCLVDDFHLLKNYKGETVIKGNFLTVELLKRTPKRKASAQNDKCVSHETSRNATDLRKAC